MVHFLGSLFVVAIAVFILVLISGCAEKSPELMEVTSGTVVTKNGCAFAFRRHAGRTLLTEFIPKQSTLACPLLPKGDIDGKGTTNRKFTTV